MDNLILILDANRGVNIPYDFVDGCRNWEGIAFQNRKILISGPDHELYWEAWEEVLETAEWHDRKTGEIYRLYQDGDLWAYSVTAYENGELDEFFGEI